MDESNKYVIRLPASLSDKFEEIFTNLDDEEIKVKMNILEYNVRISTLEEVFNQIGEKVNKELIEEEYQKNFTMMEKR